MGVVINTWKWEEHMGGKQVEVRAKQVYTMPYAEKGLWVLWWDSPHQEGESCPALITEVGNEQVTLQVFVANFAGSMGKDGVRHASDPRTKQILEIGNGVWDYLPYHKEVQAQLARLTELVVAERHPAPEWIEGRLKLIDQALKSSGEYVQKLAERVDALEAAATAPKSPPKKQG